MPNGRKELVMKSLTPPPAPQLRDKTTETRRPRSTPRLSLRGAQRRSNPHHRALSGGRSLRGVYPRAARSAGPWARNDGFLRVLRASLGKPSHPLPASLLILLALAGEARAQFALPPAL